MCRDATRESSRPPQQNGTSLQGSQRRDTDQRLIACLQHIPLTSRIADQISYSNSVNLSRRRWKISIFLIFFPLFEEG